MLDQYRLTRGARERHQWSESSKPLKTCAVKCTLVKASGTGARLYPPGPKT